MTKSEKMKLFAPTVLRIGIAMVFLWFGSSQLINASAWVNLIPKSIIAMSHLTAVTLVHFNGAFEIVFGLCLLLGFFTSITSFLLALHMLSITSTIGYNAIGVRDFGLSIATISIFLYGISTLSIDSWLDNRVEKKIE